MKVTLQSKSVLCAGASALVMSAVAPAAIAQDQDEGQRTLSTVTVTATQRAESIQDVPIAVTALDAETLDRAGVAELNNLDSVAPSFNMNSSDTATGGTTLRIRGVGTTGNNIGLESAVGVFLDGVYLSRPGVALGDLMDLEQLEVLRGPQGTLFGRNTSAGALNIKTKKPNLQEFEGFGNWTVGNFNLTNVQAGVSIPVIQDKLGIRLSGALRKRDGLVNGLNGDESHNRDRITLRGQALYEMGDYGSIRAILDYSEAEEDCCFAVWATETSFAALYGPAGLPADGGAPFVGDQALENLQSNDQNFFNPFKQTGFSLEYNVDTPLGALTYIGSARNFQDNTFRNTDFTGLREFTVGASPEAMALEGQAFDPRNNPSEITTSTHELRIQNTAFNDRLDWLVGLYYSEENIDAQGSLTLLQDFQRSYSVGSFGNANNILNTLAGGVDATGQFATNKFTQDGESFSIFTHNIFSVTDKFDLTVGLRYVDESKDGTFEQIDGSFDACLGNLANLGNIVADPTTAPFAGASVIFNCFVFSAPAIDPANPTPLIGALLANPATAPITGLLPQEFDDTFEDEEVVYTIKGSYALNDDINIYGGFTHGFKSGGFNLDASAGAGGADPRFASEIVDAWEFGVKADLWDGRARANLAIFQQDLEDFQVLEFTGTRFQTFNVGKAQATGFELETEAALSEEFLGNFSVTYSDANYPDDCDNTGGTNINSANLCGATLTNAPEWVVVGGLTYQDVFGQLPIFANANFRYESERRTSTQPTELGTTIPLQADIQDANTKVNLRIGVSSPDENWTVELWGRNVTDEITKNVTFNIPLRGPAGDRARGQFTQEPATYGVTLRTKF